MALVNNEQGELCGHVCAQHRGQLLYGVKKGLLQCSARRREGTFDLDEDEQSEALE